eukprot:CAMPEP_0174896702 /NCGR_PEP_ID=MMETSP0167-20121228/10829_1 /TAXON_ID=38298 /ORGANISM="Rhodella maculata, Strain CCMP736" /LENGTH=54 /DNA_ID=CAMNT_0016136337 /DNA_START=957 /DNA_END=1118 /DNA_ORIENTATION=-
MVARLLEDVLQVELGLRKAAISRILDTRSVDSTHVLSSPSSSTSSLDGNFGVDG